MGAIGPPAAAAPKVLIKAKNVVRVSGPVTGKPPGKTLIGSN